MKVPSELKFPVAVFRGAMGGHTLVDAGRFTVAIGLTHDQAQYIALAVNHFQEMRTALESVVTKWQLSQDLRYRRMNLPTPKDEIPEHIEAIKVLLSKLNQAEGK